MNPYEQYQRQMVTTMTQGDMLLKLYDEALKQIAIAKRAIKSNNLDEMDKALKKTEKILRYLRGALDFRVPVSRNLSMLYDYFCTQLVMANVKKDVGILEEIEPLVSDLRDTFSECDKISRSNRTARPQVGSVV